MGFVFKHRFGYDSGGGNVITNPTFPASDDFGGTFPNSSVAGDVVFDARWLAVVSEGARSITGGAFRYTVDAGNPKEITTENNATISGDYTKTIKIDMVTYLANTSTSQSANFRIHNTAGTFLAQIQINKDGASATNQWKVVTDADIGVSIETTSYASDTIYLKIARVGSVTTLSWSSDGIVWTDSTNTLTGSSVDVKTRVASYSRWTGGNLVVDFDDYTLVDGNGDPILIPRHKIDALGDARLDGNGELIIDSDGSFVTVNNGNDEFIYGDQTFEQEIRFTPKSVAMDLMLMCDVDFVGFPDQDRNQLFWNQSTGNVEWFCAMGNVTKAAYSFSWTPVVDTEYTMTLSVIGSTVKIFIDGVSQTLTETTPKTTLSGLSANAKMRIGWGRLGGGNAYSRMYVNYARIRVGTARSSNFTPQTGDPDLDAFTKLALNFEGAAASTDIIDSALPVYDFRASDDFGGTDYNSAAVSGDNYNARWSESTGSNLPTRSITGDALVTDIVDRIAVRTEDISLTNRVGTLVGDFAWKGRLTISGIVASAPVVMPQATLNVVGAGSYDVGYLQSGASGINGLYTYNGSTLEEEIAVGTNGGPWLLELRRTGSSLTFWIDGTQYRSVTDSSDLSVLKIVNANTAGGSGNATGFTATWDDVELNDNSNGDGTGNPLLIGL